MDRVLALLLTAAIFGALGGLALLTARVRGRSVSSNSKPSV
jgi:hypothetical protein